MTKVRFEKTGEFHKASNGIAYGWAVVSTVDGEPYTDLQGDYIPADTIPEVAADFMANHRVGKDMHAGNQVADVIFAWPATDEIGKGVGYSGSKTGLLIGWRPYDKALLDAIAAGDRIGFSIGGELLTSDESKAFVKSAQSGQALIAKRTFRTWKLREISLVDRPAQEGALVGVVKRAPIKKRVIARTFSKQAVLTSETDGHVHAIDLDDPACAWQDMYSTSYQTVEGASAAHSHSWTFDGATGAVTIGADSGHTHTVDAVIPADVLAAYAALDAADDAENEAIAAEPIPELIADEESSGMRIAVSIAARAPDTKSTRSQPASKPVLTPAPIPTEKTAMPTPEETKIADLEKQLQVTKQLATLTDAQRAFHKSLTGDDAAAFLAKSQSERNAAIAELEKANEVVYTSKSTGKVFRKSDEATGLVDMAKQLDAQAEMLAKSTLAGETLSFEKRAKEEIGNLAGETVTKVAALRAISTITDEKLRGDVITMLKSADAFAKEASIAKGVNPGEDAGHASALVKFNVARDAFAKSVNKPIPQATNDFLSTPEGAALYAATLVNPSAN